MIGFVLCSLLALANVLVGIWTYNTAGEVSPINVISGIICFGMGLLCLSFED